MSAESAKSFLAKMKTDEKFAQEVLLHKEFDKLAEAAKAAGFSFTKEEFKAACGDLAEGDLDKVAGGANSIRCCSSGWWFNNY